MKAPVIIFMDESPGHVVYEGERSTFLGTPDELRPGHASSEATAHAIDRAVHDISQGAFQKVVATLLARRRCRT